MEIIDSVYFFEKMLHSDMETTGDLQSPKIQSQNPNLTQCKVQITFICWFYFLQEGQHIRSIFNSALQRKVGKAEVVCVH